jgi:dTDP-4-dehydrorhamnose 3,5-epimerase
MKLNHLAIADVVEILPVRHEDERGYFSETFRQDWFFENVARVDFVQENQSLSRDLGVVRGLHFQSHPFAQGKLVRCMTGAIFDVAVDIRTGSPTFGRWVAATLTAQDGNQLWIPSGFLHGFCTLATNTVVAYKVTNYYNRECDKGVRWDDADVDIAWPEVADASRLSPKDAQQPPLRDLLSYFDYATMET